MAIALPITVFAISRAPCFQLIGELTCRVETSEKLVALTFDDGPTPSGVDAVLPVLEHHRVKATFFLVGDALPIIIDDLQARGFRLVTVSELLEAGGP